MQPGESDNPLAALEAWLEEEPDPEELDDAAVALVFVALAITLIENGALVDRSDREG